MVVTYSTIDGTAISTGAHPDFTAVTNGHVTIPKGQTHAYVAAARCISPTRSSGPAETFTLNLTGATGAATRDRSTQAATIPATPDHGRASPRPPATFPKGRTRTSS